MIKSNFDSFFKGFNSTIKEIEEQQNKDAIRIVLYAHNRVLSLSPVDTGRYRASNAISINTVTSWYASEGKSSGEYTSIADSESNKLSGINVKKTKTIFIQNNLKYAEAIENGHSQQAAQGVYAIAESDTKSRFEL